MHKFSRVVFLVFLFALSFIIVVKPSFANSNSPQNYQIKIWQGTNTSVSTIIKDWTTICSVPDTSDDSYDYPNYNCTYNIGNASAPVFCSVEGDYYFQWRMYEEGTGTYEYTYTGANDTWIDDTSGSVNGVFMYNVNWDNDEADCNCKEGTGHWNLGGDYANPYCCGDDPNEYVSTCQGQVNACSGSTDNVACCKANTECVYSNTCYANGSTRAGWLCDDANWTDVTPPSCSISSLSGTSGTYYVSGTHIWYNTVSSGGFDVGVSANDDGSGIKEVDFPDTVSSGGSDTSSPYSWSYSWSTSSSYSNTATVTCYDNVGNSNTASFIVTKDTTAPSGGYVKYPNTVYTIDHITVGLNAGSDNSGGSGIASGELQEATAALSGTTCGSFGSWQDVASTLSSTYTVNIANNTCYKFRYVVKDRVNNQVIYSSANIVKVKLNAPYYCGYLVAKPWLNLNSSSGTVGIVDYHGNFLIKATVTHTNTVPPNSYSNSLVIEEQSQPYFLFNLNDAYIKGDFVDAASVPAADGGDLIINYSQPVANFNSNGNIYLKGYALYIGATTPCGSGFVCDNTYNCVLQ